LLIDFSGYSYKTNDDVFDVKNFDLELNDKIVTHEYFDFYLKNFPNSDYLLGMKMYYMLNPENYLEVLKFYKNHKKNNPNFINGSFTLYALALIENYKYNTLNYEKILNQSLKKDTLLLNKYVRLELAEYHFENNIKLSKKFIEQSLKIDSSYSLSLIYNGMFLLQEFEQDKYEKHLYKIIEKNKCAVAYVVLTDYLYSIDKNKFEILNLVNQGLKIEELPELLLLKGNLLNEREKYSLRAYELEKYNKEVLESLGWYYIEEKNYEKGLTFFKEGFQAFPKEQKSDFTNLIQGLLFNSKFIESFEYINMYNVLYGRAIEIDALNLVAYVNLNLEEEARLLYRNCLMKYDKDDLHWMKVELEYWNIGFKF